MVTTQLKSTVATPTMPTGSAPAVPNPNLQYYGGGVLNAPVLNDIFVGDFWKTSAGKNMAQYADSFAKDVGHSSLTSVWAQYGCGPTTFGGSTTEAGTVPSQVGHPELEAMLRKALASGVQPNAQGIYNIMLPPGTTINLGDGVAYPAFHDFYKDPSGKTIYYTVNTYSTTDIPGADAKQIMTYFLSHEISEAMTDPNEPWTGTQGYSWYDPTSGYEIGDLGEGPNFNQTAQLDGFTVNPIWSVEDNQAEVVAKNPGPIQALPPAQTFPTPTPAPKP